jgi:hypothetical protein
VRNPSNDEANISSLRLSDSVVEWSFPEGTVMAPYEHLVIAADGEPDEGPIKRG